MTDRELLKRLRDQWCDEEGNFSFCDEELRDAVNLVCGEYEEPPPPEKKYTEEEVKALIHVHIEEYRREFEKLSGINSVVRGPPQ